MGWFHNLNLKRKVVGVLTDRLEKSGLTVEEIAELTGERPEEVAALLDVMQEKGIAQAENIGGNIVCFRLNSAEPTVSRIVHAMKPEEAWENVRGYRMNFRITEDQRWEAQVSELPGMPFLGRTKEEASQNALRMAMKLAPRGE